MTREEAIKILKAIRVYECYPKSASEETKEAIDLAIEALSAETEQVTGKLKNPCDSLLTDDSGERKEQKSKLESDEVAPRIDHDREWIIGCIEHDGFIHTHRFDKANQIIHDALSAEAVQGEWVWSDEDASWMCGACCCVFEEIDWKPNYNFCPNCGARMIPYKGGDSE